MSKEGGDFKLSDLDRAPLVRVQVDQEVFVDTVRAGDQLQDATVATEVTSFDRVGDAYVLEGAIVFAGYVHQQRRNEPGDAGDSLVTNSTLDFEQGTVQHVHHRMPFVLRVPIRSQPRGLVNVASRISRWNLAVLEAGWVQVTADLSIVGLNGQQGYHFQCGAQEDGDVLFVNHSDMETARMEVIEQQDGAMMRSMESDPADYRADAGDPNDASVPSSNALLEFTASVSEARGGLVADEGFGDDEDPANSQDAIAARTEPSLRQDLADFDRVFAGEDGSTVPSEPRSSSDSAPQESNYGAASEESQSTWAEFEFEDQVSLGELQSHAARPPDREERFVPSRSFSTEGFHAASGFVASQAEADAGYVNGQGAPADESRRGRQPYGTGAGERDFGTDGLLEYDAQEAADRGEKVGYKDGLWSFVDFNAPERAHTLRFIVVQEEETLDLLAARSECSKTELIRLNHLTSESLVSGQMLLTPNRNGVGAR